MKIYEIKLKPKTFFASSLQGDMLFGCLCWQLANAGYDLDKLLEDYSSSPFMVISSGFYYEKGRYLLPKPLCPDSLFLGRLPSPQEQKDLKKSLFICLYEDETLNISGDSIEEELTGENSSVHSSLRQHNSISRITNTTGAGEFSPFYRKSFIYKDTGFLCVFAAIDEEKVSKEILEKIFYNLGKTGFGKRASSGYGHFEVVSIKESPLWDDLPSYPWLYALSPFVLSKEEQQNINRFYFQVITKYGKHGDIKAKSNKPFKKPIIMADTGSIISLKSSFNKEKPFIGSAVKNISYMDSKTVAQGYALCLPCNFSASDKENS